MVNILTTIYGNLVERLSRCYEHFGTLSRVKHVVASPISYDQLLKELSDRHRIYGELSKIEGSTFSLATPFGWVDLILDTDLVGAVVSIVTEPQGLVCY